MDYNILEKIWPQWTIVDVLGEGAFGKVYKIVREDFGEKFEAALKVINIPRDESEIKAIMAEVTNSEDVTSFFKSVAEDIIREFVIMEHLKGNTNIVNYEDHVVIPKENSPGYDIYIRMELLTPFTEYMLDHDVDESLVRKLGIDICQALELCHSENIIHRDVKPQNIFLSKNGDFKLGDFGVARTAEKTQAAMSKKGTHIYMAPEVFKGLRYDKTVDLYSLGILMYRLLNDNREPFMPPVDQPVTFSNKEEALQRRFDGETPSPPRYGNDGLVAVIMKAIAFDPDRRFSSAREMREALLNVTDSQSDVIPVLSLQNEVSSSEHTMSIFATSEPEPVPEPKPEPVSEPKPKPKKSSGFPMAPVAFGIIAIAAVIGYFVLGGNRGGTRKADGDSQIIQSKSGDLTSNEFPVGNTPEEFMIKTVRAGNGYTIGIRNDNEIVLAGNQSIMESGVEDWVVTNLKCGGDHIVGLLEDGSLIAAGNNDYGQCDVYDWTDIKKIACGENFTLAVDKDGKVLFTGDNNNDQGDVENWSDISQISCGENYTIGLKKDGTVLAAGKNSYGKKGTTSVEAWKSISQISCGDSHTVGVCEDGSVVATGNNAYGQCDVDSWDSITMVSAGDGFTVGLKDDGTVVVTGLYSSEELGLDDWTDIKSISCGSDFVIGLKSDESLVSAGNNKEGQCDLSSWYEEWN